MDTVYLRQLRVDAIIGIHPWERRIRQTLFIDLEMSTDCGLAAASDRVEDTVDYSAVSDTVTKFIVGGEFHLLETLADGLARELLDCYSLSWLRLRVSKPGAVPTADDVGVVVERGAHLQNGTP